MRVHRVEWRESVWHIQARDASIGLNSGFFLVVALTVPSFNIGERIGWNAFTICSYWVDIFVDADSNLT